MHFVHTQSCIANSEDRVVHIKKMVEQQKSINDHKKYDQTAKRLSETKAWRNLSNQNV